MNRRRYLLAFLIPINLIISLFFSSSIYAQYYACGIPDGVRTVEYPPGSGFYQSCCAQPLVNGDCTGGGCVVCNTTPACDCSQSYDNICYWGCGSYCGVSCGGNPPPTPTPTPLPADLTVSSISLHDSEGALRSSRAFSPLEPIYVRTVLTNQGSGYPDSASYHAVYKNDTSMGMTIWTSADWPPGASYEYESWTGGTRDYRFSTPSFTQTTPGAYTLRVVADYQSDVTESNNGNNERTINYTILSPDLDITGFWLADRNGTIKGTSSNPFFKGYDRVFPIVEISNVGDGRANSTDNGTDSQIFAHKPTSAAVNEVSPENVSMRNGEFTAGLVKIYEAFPGGDNESVFNNNNSWTIDNAGTFTARVHVNYDHDAIESNYGNNQATRNYVVVDPYRIRGRVFNDRDKTGTYSSTSDEFLSGFTVQAYDSSDKLIGTDTTDADGYYSFYPLPQGDYQVRLSLPSSYRETCPTTRSVTVGPDSLNNHFCVFGKYSVTGSIFVDDDTDKILDADESRFNASPHIAAIKPANAPSPIIVNNTDGTYIIENLISGSYSFTYNALPSGYTIVHPRNGPPPRFVISMGTCDGGSPEPTGICAEGSYTEVNYAINKGSPWFQALGLDVRIDTGVYNPIPSYPNEACGGAYTMIGASSETPGLLITGNVSSNLRLGQASPDPFNWLVGGSTYPEIFSPLSGSIRTSYTYMKSIVTQSSISTTNLSSVCTLANCTLPGSMESGVYVAQGDVNLQSFTAATNRDIVILIDGDLTVSGTLQIPTTSTVFYSVSGDIKVNPNVGRTASCPAPSVGDGDIEGFFSTDGSFITLSQANCNTGVADKQLNVQGAIVVNANQKGGSFTNQRDLCTANVSYPSFTIKERPDFILHAPDIMKVPNYIWEEVAP